MISHLASPIAGTLIVVIPTGQGVIVAADSLSSIAGVSVPSRPKLQTISTFTRTVFTITGTATFVPKPPPKTDLATWLQTAKPIFSGADIIRDAITRVGDVAISIPLLASIADDLVHEFNGYFAESPDVQRQFTEQEICRPLILQYDPATEHTTIATFLIRSDNLGLLSVEELRIDELASNEARYVGRFGEQEYVDANVLRPGSVGWTHLGSEIEQLWNEPKLIRDMVPKNAAKIASLLIGATEQASRTIPIKTAVGGKPSIMLIDGRGDPKVFN